MGASAAGARMMWLLRLIGEPIRVALHGLRLHASRFAAASRSRQALAVGLTLIVASVIPIGLVVTSMVPLSYTTGHPLARVAWDLGLILVTAEVVQVLPLILIPLSVLSLHGLVDNTVERAKFYREKEE